MDELEIGLANEQTANKSLELLFGNVRQIGHDFRVHPVPIDDAARDGLFAARRGRLVVGAVLSVVQPGRTGLVWPPRLLEGEPPETADRLMEAVHARLTAADVAMVYSALPAVHEPEDRFLRAQGYDPMAEVLYLVSDTADFPAARPETPLDLEPYSDANHGRLARTIEATYEGTLDCPRLAGIRQIEDVLTGYRHVGDFDPHRWLLARHLGQDVGCLIVTDHPDHGCCELVYMGLVPAARGREWGRQLARTAQWLTVRAGREQLVVAVDAANEPAIRVYTSTGFRVWDRRVVYVKKCEERKAMNEGRGEG